MLYVFVVPLDYVSTHVLVKETSCYYFTEVLLLLLLLKTTTINALRGITCCSLALSTRV